MDSLDCGWLAGGAVVFQYLHSIYCADQYLFSNSAFKACGVRLGFVCRGPKMIFACLSSVNLININAFGPLQQCLKGEFPLEERPFAASTAVRLQFDSPVLMDVLVCNHCASLHYIHGGSMKSVQSCRTRFLSRGMVCGDSAPYRRRLVAGQCQEMSRAADFGMLHCDSQSDVSDLVVRWFHATKVGQPR